MHKYTQLLRPRWAHYPLLFCLLLLNSVSYATNLSVNQAEASPLSNAQYPSKISMMIKKSGSDYFGLMPYNENYLMQTYSNGNFYDKTNMHHEEVKFQISLAIPVWAGIVSDNSVLGVSYTQQSWFQLTNGDQSSPFRETNYEPQVFLGWATNYELPWGWTLNEIESGFNHQSNGRSDENQKSRSWNRLYARLAARNGNWLVEVKPWWRIPESTSSDDNPDINHYRGYFDLSVGYDYKGWQTKATGHYNWIHNKAGIEVSASYPMTKHMRFYVQYYGGYGESLVDYNKNIQRIGLGISLNNVF